MMDKYLEDKDMMIITDKGRGGRIQWCLWGGDIVLKLNHQSWMRYQLRRKYSAFFKRIA